MEELKPQSHKIPGISFLYESWSEVRRLGIIREIINIIGEHGYIPERKLIKDFYSRIDRLNKAIDKYERDPTGHFELKHQTYSQRGTLKNYLTMSRLLDFTRILVTRWILSNFGKLIFSLPREENPINLTLIEKIAFLKKILEKDADYFIQVLESINDQPESISDQFKKRLEKLYENLMKNKMTARYRTQFRNQKKAIENWSKSRANHMTYMRMAWAVDLGFCIKDDAGARLSNAGKELIRLIPKRHISNSIYVCKSNLDYLETEYYHTINKIYKIKAFEEELSSSELLSFIQENFNLFTSKRLKIRKISDVPILEKMALEFLVSKKDDKRILEISYLREKLRETSKNDDRIYYVWDRRGHTGWIILR